MTFIIALVEGNITTEYEERYQIGLPIYGPTAHKLTVMIRLSIIEIAQETPCEYDIKCNV